MAVFVRLAHAGSFTAAARALGSTTSAVSKCVSRLEDRLGVRLVERTTRSFALTETGRIFRRHCERILRHVEAATFAVQQSKEAEIAADASRAFDARLTEVTAEDPDERPYPNTRDTEVVLP
jgi:DNA-binding transcriptional LysR family regulator